MFSSDIACQADPIWNEFRIPGWEEFNKLYNKYVKSYCSLDNCPPAILKLAPLKFRNDVFNWITLLLQNREFPVNLGHILITPITENPKESLALVNNYRPIAAIPFFIKIMEGLVSIELRGYLEKLSILHTAQPRFPSFHITEMVLMLLLDQLYKLFSIVSTAFDLDGHEILVRCLDAIRKSGQVFQWFKGFLESRTYQVRIDEQYSFK